MSSSKKNAVSTVKTGSVQVSAEVHKDANEHIMTILNSILENQKKQDEKIGKLSNKMISFEEYYDDNGEGEEYYENNEEGEVENDENDNVIVQVGQSGGKRKTEDESTTTSRFHSMTKRFKNKEVCDEKLDEVLAQNITDVFRNGMNEE